MSNAMMTQRICDVPFLAPLNNACVAWVNDPAAGKHVLYASFYAAGP